MKCAAVSEGITTEFKREYTNVNYEAETTVQKNPVPERDQQILESISTKQLVSRAEIEAAASLSQSVTVRTLKKLMELGLMQKRGNEKNTVYYRESK